MGNSQTTPSAKPSGLNGRDDRQNFIRTLIGSIDLIAPFECYFREEPPAGIFAAFGKLEVNEQTREFSDWNLLLYSVVVRECLLVQIVEACLLCSIAKQYRRNVRLHPDLSHFSQQVSCIYGVHDESKIVRISGLFQPDQLRMLDLKLWGGLRDLNVGNPMTVP